MPDTVERELVDLERRYWQALKDRDVATALELTDEPCIVAGAHHRGEHRDGRCRGGSSERWA